MPATTPTTPPTSRRGPAAGPTPAAGTSAFAVALAGALDAVCVLGFAATGRSSHAESGGPVAVLGTAWPFLVACAVGWVVTRAWRRPARVWPTGVVVWALTWAAGLALRGLTGDSLAPAFVAVTAAVLALLLLGWRGLATAISSVRGAGRRTSVPARRR